MEVTGLLDRCLLGELRDLEDVDLGLQFGDLVVELVTAFGERSVFRAESRLVDHSRLVKVIELVDL